MSVSKNLYVNKFGMESTSEPFDETKDSYKAEPIGNGLYLGKKIDLYKDGREIQNVYSQEIGYGGGNSFTWVGSLNHTEKKYNHTHGYYKPHKTGKKLANYALANGFDLR